MTAAEPDVQALGADLQEQRHKEETAALRRQLKEALSKQVLDQRYQEFAGEVAALPNAPPSWTTTKKRGKPKQATPVAHLSDTHWDEYVDPAQVNWVNAYDREIAGLRLRRFPDRTIRLCDEYLTGVEYPGIVVPISGDMFSGNIHDELKETNAGHLTEALRYWIDQLEAVIKVFAEHFGKVYIPWVVGNHPRQSKKPRAKGAVRDNFDWLLGSLLARDFARDGDKRVRFEVSEALDLQFNIYQTRYLQTHGNQFRGGSGIAAELSPLLIGESRKREKHQAVDDPFDVLICGHWHRRNCLERVKMNGSVKGYDEYALGMPRLRYQEPMLSFWLDTPEHGITIEAPIFVAHPAEKWRKDIPERRANALEAA